MISVSFVLHQPAARMAAAAAFAASDDMLVLDCGGTVWEAQAFLRARPPRVAFVELALGDEDGAALLAEVAEALPATSVIAVGTGAVEAIRALRGGAIGFLEGASATPAEWLAAAREAHLGGAPLSRGVARFVVTALARERGAGAARPVLTPRERDVLAQLATGATYRRIGGQLGISEDTVRAHIRGIYRKLRVRTRDEAISRRAELEAAAPEVWREVAC
ncbi:MAG: response regulator transcription factor [Candidatus Didemnitutus sp.]|nr:response regulator transcription factor [Candidatus Didemnitutus sp.]